MRKFDKIVGRVQKALVVYLYFLGTPQPTFEDGSLLDKAILSAFADQMFKFKETDIDVYDLTDDEKLFYSATGYVPVTAVDDIIKRGTRDMLPPYKTIFFYYKTLQKLYAIEMYEDDEDEYEMYPDEPELPDKQPEKDDPYFCVVADSFSEHISRGYTVRISTRLYRGGRYLPEFCEELFYD